MNSRSVAFASWCLLGIGAVAICLTAYDLWFGAASKAWPSVPGVVEASGVQRLGNLENGSKTKYRALIRYRYTVHNQMLTGNRIGYWDYSYPNRSDAQAIIGRYPPKRPVTVYYQPGNPARCVLEPGVHLTEWFVILFGAVFFSGGILCRRANRPHEWDGHYGW